MNDENVDLLNLLALCRNDKLSEVVDAILHSEWLKDRDVAMLTPARTQALEDAARIVETDESPFHDGRATEMYGRALMELAAKIQDVANTEGQP